jgi:hypothetical protein
MEKDIKHSPVSLNMADEKEAEIFNRCFSVVGYLNDTAMGVILDFIQNATCPVSTQILRNTPGIIVIRAYEKAINILAHEIRSNELKV